MLDIVVHILHAGLFVAAQQGTDRITQFGTGVFQVLERIEAKNTWPLVVHNTAAKQKAILLSECEGVIGPTITFGYDIHMGDGGEIALPPILTDGSITDLVLAVYGFEPELFGDLKSAVQCLAGFNSERSAFVREKVWG